MADDEKWFSVRCIFYLPDEEAYEERITMWRAASHEYAIELAEQEARELAKVLDIEYVELAQSYELFDDPTIPGSEVFSLIRRSSKSVTDYLSAFFDTGYEIDKTIGTDGSDASVDQGSRTP